jgi:hypothetical protein
MSVSADRAIRYYSDRQTLLQALKAYTDQNGIGNVTYTHKSTDLGIRASARGTKQLSDRWFTFETVRYVLPP